MLQCPEMSKLPLSTLMAIAKEIPPDHDEFLAYYDTLLGSIARIAEDRPYILVYLFLVSLQDQDRSIGELRANLIDSGKAAIATKHLDNAS
jgi:hypothetical protein